jgi:23S rRNA (cytidine1920-2'-O)/16S rRNA (cytidine1409-2'-O)-methyltransferase
VSPIRVDKALVDRGLCRSRQIAHDLIMTGKVRVTGQLCTHPSEKVRDSDLLELDSHELETFVSRGGLKLEAALKKFEIDVSGLTVLDIGQSTGGFTDCTLQRGAAKVVGIDVGSGQLAEKLKHDPRVQTLENINFRDLQIQELESVSKANHFGLILADLSFISLKLLAKQFFNFGQPGTQYVILVKPQFEVGSTGLGKGGIVQEKTVRELAVQSVCEALEEAGLKMKGKMESEVKGGDGNQEYFIYFLKP